MIRAVSSDSATPKAYPWLKASLAGWALVGVLSLLKLAFDDALGSPVPFLLYFGAVFAAAWIGGTAAGLLTTGGAAIAAFTLFIYPKVLAGASPLSTLWQIAGFILENVVITLITDRLNHERERIAGLTRELHSINTRLSIVVRGMSDGVTVQDRSGRLVYANAPAAKLAGFAMPEEMVEADPREMLSRFNIIDDLGKPLPQHALPSREALETGRTCQAVIGFTTVDTAEERWSSITSNPLLDQNGRVEHVVNVFRDVTASRSHEEAVRVSREWFSTALRSIGEGVIATDEHNCITFINPVAESLTGWSLESAKGQPLANVLVVLNQHTREPIASPIERALRGPLAEALAEHILLRRKDGSEIAIEDSAAPIRNGAGALVGVVVVFRDVSAKRRAELGRAFLTEAATELEVSLDYHTTLANVARLAVPTMADWCTIDMSDGRGGLRRLAVAHVDPAKRQLIDEIQRRYPPDPEQRRGALAVLDSGRVAFVPDISEAMLAAIVRDEEHLGLITQLGLRSYIGVPLKRGGKTIGVITLATAESQRRYDPVDVEFAVTLAERAAMAVDRALIVDELQRANRAKDEFFAILGHELRNPLAPIYSALDVMNQRAGDALKQERLVIERQLKHVMRLVDDLLDVSRISGGKVELQRSRVSLSDVVATAIEMASTLIRERSLQITLDVPEQLIVDGDRVRLTQVVSNILHNAAKYGRVGGRIWITGKQLEDSVILSLRDDGIGITADMLPRVFELFSQEAQALDRAKGGLGLGLAIVKSLVDLHGGSVAAQSEGSDKGATFTVTLPVPERAPNAERISQTPRPSGHATRVLIVDDNQDALELLVMGIELLGNEVFSAPDAGHALAAVEAHRPEVAFMDVGLPDMDGYELARRIRQLDHQPRTKLVAVTGYGRAADRERALEAGFDAHMVKPVSLLQIQQMLETLDVARL